jgi:hypothetical protein
LGWLCRVGDGILLSELNIVDGFPSLVLEWILPVVRTTTGLDESGLSDLLELRSIRINSLLQESGTLLGTPSLVLCARVLPGVGALRPELGVVQSAQELIED